MEKKADIFFSFLSGLCPFPELWPFDKIWMKFCQHNISKTTEARPLKLGKQIGCEEQMTSFWAFLPCQQNISKTVGPRALKYGK